MEYSAYVAVVFWMGSIVGIVWLGIKFLDDDDDDDDDWPTGIAY